MNAEGATSPRPSPPQATERECALALLILAHLSERVPDPEPRESRRDPKRHSSDVEDDQWERWHVWEPAPLMGWRSIRSQRRAVLPASAAILTVRRRSAAVREDC
jgi:hypothetical protein